MTEMKILIYFNAFDLVGKEIVAAGKYSASDHWAITFKFFLCLGIVMQHPLWWKVTSTNF